MNDRLIADLEKYFDRLWPILRSITGEGVRETHKILSEIVSLNTYEIPTGENVYDWTIPKEWKVNDAYVIDPKGNKILDVKKNNLHLLNYSIPFKGEVELNDLNKHLYSIPTKPNAIPYVTSYYEERWGFCISENERKKLKSGIYKVIIDSFLFNGSLTISDAVLPGEVKKEILFSTYTCHPSLANNELSGPLVTAFLYQQLSKLKNRYYTYRFVFGPETIGAISYLHKYGKYLRENLFAGFIVTCVGDDGKFSYKKTKAGDSQLDKAIEYLVNTEKSLYCDILDFFPSGSDERQFCSPGFNLPVGSLMRTMYAKYPEYHTSLDNKSIISFQAMAETITEYMNVCDYLEKNRFYRNVKPYCEPFLSKYDLYPTLSNLNSEQSYEFANALRWLLSYSDGKNDLIDLAKKSNLPFELFCEVANKCKSVGLIEELQ